MNQQQRSLLIEAIIAGGLTAIGFATGQGPLLTLATTAAGMGGNWVSSIAERSYHQWRENWFTERGALNQDIHWALSRAFQDAVRQLEHDWKLHPHFNHLKRSDHDAAERLLAPLRWLREDAGYLLIQPVRLTDALQTAEVTALRQQNEAAIRSFLNQALRNYLYGHDQEMVSFIETRLPDEWLLRFNDLLRGTGEQQTRAWRSFQQLWQMSMTSAV